MSEPTTKAGQAVVECAPEDVRPRILADVLAIEAEAREQERERLRKAVKDRWPEWQVGGPVSVPVIGVLALLSKRNMTPEIERKPEEPRKRPGTITHHRAK